MDQDGAAPGNLRRMTGDAGNPATNRSTPYSMLAHVLKFAFLSGVLLFVAWMAGTGRVAYILIMLLIAAALGFAVVDSVGYAIVKRERRG
jgi:hypothetical protein